MTTSYATRAPRAGDRMISSKQQAFIATLAGDRTLDVVLTAKVSEASLGGLTTRQASTLIDDLKAAPRAGGVTAAAQAEPGYYTTEDDRFVCVVKTKDGQRTYAKVLGFHPTESGAMRPSWDYAPGVGRTLAGLTPLTAEQVRHFGHLHGYCVKCLKPLTDPASVERGAGKTCWKRLVRDATLAA